MARALGVQSRASKSFFKGLRSASPSRAGPLETRVFARSFVALCALLHCHAALHAVVSIQRASTERGLEKLELSRHGRRVQHVAHEPGQPKTPLAGA